MMSTQHYQNLADRLTPVSQHDKNLAEWEHVRSERFPHVTDPSAIHELHIAFMLGYSRGMIWMRDLYNKELSK